MKNKITLSLILLINTLIFSQNKFELGTIHFKNGKTEKGYIQYSNGTIKSDNITYKKSLDDDTKNLTPSQTISIIFQETSRQITTDNIDGKEKFLEIIVKGKSNLLFLSEEKGNKRYFLRSDKSGLKELKVSEKVTSSKRFIFKEYIGVLNLDFNDCNEISDKINASKFQLKSLAKVFTIYNQCVNEIQFTSERLDKKDFHNISFLVGYNSTSINEKGTNLRGKNFDNSSNIVIGTEYIYTPTFFNSNIGIIVGLYYNKNDTSTDYIRSEVFARDFETTQINLETLNIKLGFQYNINRRRKKINPTLGLYYINSRLLNKDDAYLRIDENGEQQFLYSDKPTQISNSISGFGLEGGFDFFVSKNTFIKVRAGYENIEDFLKLIDDNYPINSFFFKLGYGINL